MEMMKGLTPLVRTLQNNTGLLITENIRFRLPFSISTNSLQSNNLGPSSQLNWPKKVTRCSYCWVSDHNLKLHCQIFRNDLNSNQIHIRYNRKVYLGLYTQRTRHISMKQGKPGRELVVDAKKLRYPSSSSANI